MANTRVRGILLSQDAQSRLQRCRENKGWSRHRLEDKAGVTEKWVYRAEKQTGKQVAEEDLAAVVQALGTTVPYILYGEEATRPQSGLAGTVQAEQSLPTGPPTGNSAIKPIPPAPSGKLDGKLEVFVYDVARIAFRSISEFGLPLHTGNGLLIRVHLNRPAWICVVWITSEGEAQPLYPWEEFAWERESGTKMIDRLMLPAQFGEHISRVFPVNTGAGTETVVLMARDAPLPSDFSSVLSSAFKTRLAKLTQFNMANPNELYAFSSLDSDIPAPSVLRLGLAHSVKDPRLRFKLVLCETLGILFDVVKGVSFANAGRVEAQNGETKAVQRTRSARRGPC
jgi:transcriptional regulator with XRE-family HTH domain